MAGAWVTMWQIARLNRSAGTKSSGSRTSGQLPLSAMYLISAHISVPVFITPVRRSPVTSLVRSTVTGSPASAAWWRSCSATHLLST